MKRVLWILLTPAVVLLIAGFAFDRFFAPKILAFATQKVESFSKDQGPFAIKIPKARLQYFPPGVVAENVTLQPKKNLSSTLSDIEIQTAKAELAIFGLLTGRLKISLVEINSPQVQVNFQRDPNSPPLDFSKFLNWGPMFETLQDIPIEQVQVKNLNLKIFEKKQKITISLYPTEIQILQLRELLQAKLSIPNVVASWDKEERVKTEVNLIAVMTPQSLRIQKFEIQNPTMAFNLSGEMKNKKGKDPETKVLWTGFVNLAGVDENLKQIFPDKKFPVLSGELRAQGSWKPTKRDLLRADFQTETKQVKVGNFSVGDASVKGVLQNQQVVIDKLKMEHPAGLLELHNTKLGLDSRLSLSSKLDLKSLDLQKLFQSLNLKKIPVEAQITGYAPCQGQLKPLEFSCTVTGTSKNLQVRSGMPKEAFEIVSLEQAKVNGDVKINTEAIEFQSDVIFDKSKGQAQGKVEFKKGFRITFKVPELHWNEVKNLSKLNLSGISELQGEVSGGTEAVTFTMKAKTSDHKIDEFVLGDTQLDLSYQSGDLLIENIKGRLNKTSYTGELKIHLKGESYLIGRISSDNARLSDIKTILEKRIPIPIALDGNGPVQVSVEGPLNFWALNTKVNGRFSQPLIATESFNDLVIDIESQNGLYNIKRAEATRSATSLSVDGTLSPEKELKLRGTLRNALLEESDWITKIGWPLSGKLNAQMRLEGTIANPDLTLSGQVSEMILDENEVPNSNFRFQIQNHKALAEGAFFGHQIQASLEWPLKEGNNIGTQLRMKTQNWDYTPWLSLFNAGAVNEETKGNLSCDVDLHSRQGKWDELSGLVKIQNFMISRHDLLLENPRPITITAENGSYDLENFVLKSPDEGKVEITGSDIHPQNLNLQINAASDLKLAQIFIPLFEEISGPIEFNASVQGVWTHPQLIGNLNIRNGYFRIKNFPHAFEKMKVDATLSQTRVLFNDIQGQLGGGTLKGEGSLQIQGPEDIPILIRVKGRDLSLNVPEGVKTKGDADIVFSGRWFPYILGGTYRIRSTLVEMNFGGQTVGSKMRENYYLPENLKEKVASPIELDLQLLFEKPIQIKNSLMEAQASGNLTIKGSPATPIILGELKALKGSKLFFKDKPFEVQAATIQFNNPTEINPNLFISAQTRVEEYDIILLAQGSAKDPNIRLSSTPPLSENDLTSLLALGVTSSQLETVDSQRQQEQTANEVFAAAFQSTGLTKRVQSATGFNVQLSNSFDTTRNISVPKFTISRKLNKNTNALVAFPVTGDQKTPEGRIEYNLNENISINGSYETRKFDQTITNQEVRETPSILGLDLEFKREFR